MYVEQEIAETISRTSRSGERVADIVMSRYGFDGGRRKTLEEVAAEHGLTRQRISQMCIKVGRRVRRPSNPPGSQQGVLEGLLLMPVLDESLDMLAAIAPCTNEGAHTRMRELGLSANGMDGVSLLAAAEFFGVCQRSLVVVENGTKVFIVRKQYADVPQTVHRAVRKLVGAQGVTTVTEVADALHHCVDESDADECESVVRLVLSSDADVVWLDEQQRWIWLRGVPEGRNRLLNNIRKVLCVAGRIEASELRRAVRRELRMNGYAPPASILLALADAVPELRRVGTAIEGVTALSRDEELSVTQNVIVEVLLQHGGVMRYEDILSEVMSYGVSRPAVCRQMSYSPIVRKYMAGVYGLSGVEVDSALVEALRPQRTRTRVVRDCSFTSDGRVWVLYKLNQSALDSCVLGIPSTIKDFVNGQHDLVGPNGQSYGTLVVKDASAWGVRRYLGITGAEAGDYVLLVFDLQEKVCCCYVGDDSLAEEVLDD